MIDSTREDWQVQDSWRPSIRDLIDGISDNQLDAPECPELTVKKSRLRPPLGFQSAGMWLGTGMMAPADGVGVGEAKSSIMGARVGMITGGRTIGANADAAAPSATAASGAAKAPATRATGAAAAGADTGVPGTEKRT